MSNNELLFYPAGATPIEDISDLKLSWVKTRAQLNEVEAENILSAYSSYFLKKPASLNWFNEKNLKIIHRDMFQNVWEWAGSYRKSQVNIGEKPIHIPFQINALCEDIIYWQKADHKIAFLEQSIWLHHRLVKIHPFVNGNGRYARFVSDLYLLWTVGKTIKWPNQELAYDHPIRREYINALQEADLGDYGPLILFITKCGMAD